MLLIFSVLLLFTQSFCQENKPTDDEALFVKRIAEFYEEKEFSVVFAQGEAFLKKYPESIYADDLRILLGDLLLDRQMYVKSLSYYTAIADQKKKEGVFFNVLECYYQRKDFEKIIESCREILGSNQSLDKEIKQKIEHTYALALFKWILEDETRNYQINEVITVFEGLKGSSYDLVAKEHLAYLYTEKKAFKASANLYLELASKVEEKKEDYLFLAAEQARKFDVELAIKTYGQICYLEGKKAKDAAFNRLLLFFEQKKYGDILVAKGEIGELLENDKKPLLHYYVARSHYALEDFQRAYNEFTTFIETTGDSELKYKSHFYLLGCLQQTKDLSLFEDVINRIEKDYKSDKLYLEALFARALIHKEKENVLSAEEDFTAILKSDLPFSQKQEMLFEWAHMYLAADNTEKAYPLFKKYLAESKDEKKDSLAWHYSIYCSVKEAEKNPTEENRIRLKGDLKSVLQKTLSPGEKVEYLYLLGKTHFQLKKYGESIKNFTYLTKAFPKTKYVNKAYLYLGYCYREKDNNHQLFTQFLEKALKSQEGHDHKDQIHLSLYNAYYKMYKDQTKVKKTEKKKPSPEYLMEKAADHLYSLYRLNPSKVSLENRLWLGGYYHQRAKLKKKSMKYIDRGIAVYQKNLFSPSQGEESQVHLESHFLRLAELCQLAKNKDLEIEALDTLKQQYDKNPNASWEFQNKTYYYLALALKEKDATKAILLFDRVGTSPFANSSITTLSLLESAKLKKQAYRNLTKEDPQYIDLVCMLKNLSLKRSLETEPVHLEASLELVDLMVDHDLDKEKIMKKKLDLLIQMKNRFMAKEDIIGKDYHTEIKRKPSKAKLFSAYMKYLDVRMLVLQYKLSKEEELKKEADRLLTDLKKTVEEYSFLRERLSEIEE